jgi:uncharacterized membrane protein YqaE (UPF0057 family)
MVVALLPVLNGLGNAMFIVGLLLLCMLSWILGTILGWFLSYRKDGDPLNWRIICPPLYSNWLRNGKT